MAVGQVVTTRGAKIMLNRTFKETPDYEAPTLFKVGVGTTTPAISDTAIETPVPLTGTESIDSCDVADWVDEATCTTSLNSTTFLEGVGALNITKDGAGAATCSTSKATTSRTFSTKQIWMWLYIKDATALANLATLSCFEIRFGNDNANYWYWQKDKSFFTTGWNYISNLTAANATGSAGAPASAACDYTFIQLTATGAAIVWSAGDFIMDNIYLASSGDFYDTYVSGYPVLDETNYQVTFRCYLSTLQCLGHSLTEFAIYNNDSTRRMFSRAVHIAITKNMTTQVFYIEKDKLTL